MWVGPEVPSWCCPLDLQQGAVNPGAKAQFLSQTLVVCQLFILAQLI